MTKIKTEYGVFTYDEYLAAFEQWVKDETSSSKNSTVALAGFTKLNLARTNRLHKTIELKPELVKLVQSMQHTYAWTVLTEAWCGDSAQTLPLIAEIARLNPEKIQLQIILRDEHPELMNNYLTNNARAIPKLVVFNETLSKESFVWGPRPLPAQELLLNWKKNPDGRSWDDFEKELHGWYAKDKSETMQNEFLQLLQDLN